MVRLMSRVREIIDIVGPLDTVFHRAFDFAFDWRKELDTLIEVGCTRILTSGGEPTAVSGSARAA